MLNVCFLHQEMKLACELNLNDALSGRNKNVDSFDDRKLILKSKIQKTHPKWLILGSTKSFKFWVIILKLKISSQDFDTSIKFNPLKNSRHIDNCKIYSKFRVSILDMVCNLIYDFFRSCIFVINHDNNRHLLSILISASYSLI